MANYGDLKARIADEIADSTLSSQIVLAIETAIAFYERKEFYFNTKTGTFSTVADQEYYGTAANSDIPSLIIVKSMTVTDSGYKSPVLSASFNDMDYSQTGLFTGLPRAFAYFNKQIRLYPIPDDAYTVTMAYVYRLTALSADEDENAWTEDAEELIRQRAKAIIAGDVLRDVDMYQAAKEMERDAFEALLKETRSRRSNSRLRTELNGGGRYNIYTDE